MNLIVITIDALRADHLGCLGYPERTTPNLDYLASTGILFSQAMSVGAWTATSFIAILTSTYPLMYGGPLRITDPRTTVAQVLKEHGYHTATFHSNPWLSSYLGYHRGFDTFDSSISRIGSESRLRKSKELVKRILGTKGKLYHFISQLYAFMFIHPVGSDLNRKAVRWLRDNPSNFFLWLHYMDVHEPYYHPSLKNVSPFERYHILKLTRKARTKPGSVSPEEVNKLIRLYDAKIRYADEIIGSLLRTLKRSNILDNTFVVITADHGQQFGDHGYFGHTGFNLYGELLHVPLIIIGPGLPSQVINQQVSLLDLAPTILDLVGIEKPNTFLGDSLLGLMKGTETKGSKLGAISETDVPPDGRRLWGTHQRMNPNRRLVSFRTGKWKYIYTEGGQDELYCLETDPGERENLIDAEPEIATELRANIAAHIEFEEKSAPSDKEQIKAKLRKLKASGKI
jgi:arylsulfatase A-like enzyme